LITYKKYFGHSNLLIRPLDAYPDKVHMPQRAKFAKKVHKPPLTINAIDFGFNASTWVPWSPSDPKKLGFTDRIIQIHKICVKIS
jgi:hypothetical protein